MSTQSTSIQHLAEVLSPTMSCIQRKFMTVSFGERSRIFSSRVTQLKKYFIFRCPTMYGPRRNKSLGFADKMIIKMQKGETLKIAHDRMDSPSYALNISKKSVGLRPTGIKNNFSVYEISSKNSVPRNIPIFFG